MRLNSLLLPILVVAMPGGCTAPQRGGEPVAQVVSCPDDAAREALWDACGDALREHYFALDVVDRRGGRMTTHPQTSQHFWEFWRHDVDTPYDFGEASLRTVRRWVEVSIAPTGGDAGVGTGEREAVEEKGAGEIEAGSAVSTADATITVTVHRETFATPERQFNNSLAAFRMFGDELPAEATGQRLSRSDDYWIPDGRDPAMERYLLQSILSR